jgi:hypothetical protein
MTRVVEGRPDARKQLEQTNPALVADRDRAITDLPREKLNQELAQKQTSQAHREVLNKPGRNSNNIRSAAFEM